jgi:hypothetical protein
LRLVDIHQMHRHGVSKLAADRAEMGLRGVMNQVWRHLLPALIPTLELLTTHQRDKQRQACKQPLLQMQRRNMQLGETSAIHPEAPPTRVVIRKKGASVIAPLVIQTVAACMPAFISK